ncbi:hypothetical protein [Sphingobacterium phlebotomi]|nr:hypothetical protein [Sphingobacterium phlebotomi]
MISIKFSTEPGCKLSEILPPDDWEVKDANEKAVIKKVWEAFSA